MALQRVDTVIAVVGAVALVATVMGVVFYEDLAGEQDIVFPVSHMTAEPQTGASGELLSFAVPDNATAAALEVVVTFTGQSGLGGNAAIQIDITGPNGTSLHPTASMAIQPNSNSATMTIPVDLFSWASVPAPRVADPGGVDETLAWDVPLTVTVTVDAPSDGLSSIPGSVVTYSFTATVTPTFDVFTAQVASPDPETL